MGVLWIGGPPASGKTTVARLIARRWGIRWYNSDAHTWDHRDRAVEAGLPAAIRWETMTVAERWSAPPDELMAMSLHHERGAMIADDLRALPAAPLIIAEGTPVTPTIAGTGRRSVWLLPPAEVHRSRLKRRNQTPEIQAWNSLLTTEILTEVAEHGGQTAISHTVQETVATVEKLFADALNQGPTATTTEDRGALLRYANEAVVAQYLAYFARPWSTGDVRAAIGSFACECGLSDCVVDIDLAIVDFPSGPLVAH
jgi:hypothetical protein